MKRTNESAGSRALHSLSRRDLLAGLGCGFGTLALDAMLHQHCTGAQAPGTGPDGDKLAASGRPFDYQAQSETRYSAVHGWCGQSH